MECHTIYESNPKLLQMCPTCLVPTEQVELLKLWKLEAKQVGHRVVARVSVVGESQQKAVNLRFVARCRGCEKSEEVDLRADDNLVLEVLTKFSSPASAAKKYLPYSEKQPDEKFPHVHQWILEPYGEPLDYRLLKARDNVEVEESGEKALSPRDYLTVLFLKLPAEKKLLVDGIVMIHPKDNDLILLVRDCVPLTTIADGFKLGSDDIKSLRGFLEKKTRRELSELMDKTIAPQIVGRNLAKLASALTAFSPNWLPPLAPGQPPQPGCIRSWNIGDARTGKGTIERWWNDVAGIGEHGIGESASRAGLLYVVDSENSVILWGLLVQADLSMCVLEGMHGLPQDQIAEFREALIQQKVEVHKKVSGAAWCRARVQADANTTKPMKEFLYPCQALLYVPCFKDSVDLTRIDIAIPFNQDDVSLDEISNTAENAKRTGVAPQLMAKLAFWAWSRKTSQIEITQEAMEKAKLVFKALQEYTCARIPLVHPGSLVQVLRISTAFAILTFSSADGERLTVEAHHVEMAREFLEEILELWGIREFNEATGTQDLSPDELAELKAMVEAKPTIKNVLYELGVGRPSLAKDLATKIDADYGYLRNVLSELRAKELVVRKNDGYTLTAKGVAVLKNSILKEASVEPYERLLDWIRKNRTGEGLLDAIRLDDKIKEFGLDPEPIRGRLVKEGLLTDGPAVGKWLVITK